MFNFRKKEAQTPKEKDCSHECIEGLERKIKEMEEKIEELKEQQKNFVQKVSLVRFNPFSDIGGDQSFSVAMLDKENDGIVMTSFYSKEGNRVYGKEINKGRCDYALSEEEKMVIKKACNEE